VSRVAVVTGAGRGIGAATVGALAAEGWSVVALDRCEDDPRLPYSLASEADLEAAVEAAGQAAADGASVVAFRGEATDEAAHADALAEARRLGEPAAPPGSCRLPSRQPSSTSAWAASSPPLASPSRSCSSARSRAPGASSPSPPPPPYGGCRGWPPTRPPRPG
jgi:NAD(P)-dependent dehydrogenase (short-subunit alcohol dehydrogenase family)